MGARSRELILLLAVSALAACARLNDTKRDKADKENDLYEDYDSNVPDEQEILFNEDKPCPRDCICTLSQGYRIAKCNRLEVGTQKFGDDITDLVIENADPAFPIDLPDFIFKILGLHRIATVKIVNSTIGTIGPKAFHDLSELYAVNLSNNKLKYLHPETFSKNQRLLLLTLANNPLTISSEFLNVSTIQELDISYCNLQTVSASYFKQMPGLMYLNLAGNNLSEIYPDTFRKLLDLEELDLSDNNIKSLPDDLFTENTELATLHIQKNPISSVYGLQISDLLTLNAGQTNIKFVGPSMFNGMKYIANLNLSGNNIEKIHNQAFHKLIELNFLDLSYNDLDFISSILIKENMELDIFKISNNPRLKHLPAEGFNSSADQFNIYMFDASYCSLEEIYDDSLKTFTALSQINLAGNKIKTISEKVFSRCTKLVKIDLAYNMLTTLEDKVFEKNTELAKLNLQGNPLKVLSAEVFVHIPALTWLDMSHAELTSLWKVDKNPPTTLLGNLNYLNVSYNRINEIKQSEVGSLNKLRTLDISNNPLACGREFENLMTWLNKHKVSPNANSASIANLAKDSKDETEPYSWEFLSKKTCGTALPQTHSVEPLPVSDEEIWERIDKETESDMDLKETLDDAKIPDDTKVTTDSIKSNKVEDEEEDDGDDADDADDADDEDDDDDDDDDTTEDYEDDDVNLKVKLLDKTSPRPQTTSTKAPEEKLLSGGVKIDIKLLENEKLYKDLEPEVYVQESVQESEHGRYDYLWPMLIAILGALLLLFVIGKVMMMVCSRRSKQVRYNSAIIAAMGHQSRTKKDCGLVYQQLSEELGPATPKLTRYQPLQAVTVNANVYESSPFHHTNIVPEAV